jgi:acyl-CoA oxidase
MSENPEKFFLAHRLLSTVGLGGFGIRFTVQFNLFAGSIVGLAGPSQLSMLKDMQAKGQLGCFLLTELQAGVLSGLIVETTAK